MNKDGWKAGESKTGSPGEKAAMSHSPGKCAEVAHYDVPGMTGSISKPENKTHLKVTTVTMGMGAGSKGTIAGNDPKSYLGHFRSPEVLKRGHNQGAPSGRVKPKYDPMTNPIKAAKQEKRQNVAAAKASGGDVKAAKTAGKAAVGFAKGVRKLRNLAGFKKSDKAAGMAARKEAKVATKAKAGGATSLGGGKKVQAPKGVASKPSGLLNESMSNVRSARSQVTDTMRPKGPGTKLTGVSGGLRPVGRPVLQSPVRRRSY